MKQVIITTFLVFLGTVAFSQMNFCRIKYSYDAAGNRIQRKYHCFEDNGPVEEGPLSSFYPVISPNPTNGPFTVSLNEFVSHVELSVYDIDGSFIGATEGAECYQINYDLSDAVPGTYIVMVQVLREDESVAQEEFTLIKNE